MLPIANRHAEAFAARHRKITLGGSVSHTLAALGHTYTSVHGARNPGEFLDGLKRGATEVGGEGGSYLKLTRAVLDISTSMMGERLWTRCLAPLLIGVPLVVLAIVLQELAFAHHWGRRTPRGVNAVAVLERSA